MEASVADTVDAMVDASLAELEFPDLELDDLFADSLNMGMVTPPAPDLKALLMDAFTTTDLPRTEFVLGDPSSEELRSDRPLDQHLAPTIDGPPAFADLPSDRTWYLGLDVGTTGVSAVLLNRQTGQLHPLYWLEVRFSGESGEVSASSKTFRLPAVVWVEENRDNQDPQFLPRISVAPLSASGIAGESSERYALQHFTPYLKVGVPYFSPQTNRWEPQIQWSDRQQVELSTLHRALWTLLATLNCPLPDVPGEVPILTCGAVGLEDGAFQRALDQLAGVTVGCPVQATEAYRFNLREAVLAAKLVSRPEQIFLAEDAIATLLSGLPGANGEQTILPHSLSDQPDMQNSGWSGDTLVINAGATLSELVLVHLPGSNRPLTHTNFVFRTVEYAGDAIDQDLICRFLYPAWLQQANRSLSGDQPSHWDWEVPLPNNAPEPWTLLRWDTLTLPSPGEPDPMNRRWLQRRLLGSSVGVALLSAARQMKIALQQQERFYLKLGDTVLILNRQDLSSRVLLFYVQRLNRELNALLTERGVGVLSINQVICSGASASFGAIARWLRQKLPNATIIQDTYSDGFLGDTVPVTCSRVAYGLASLPLHPQLLDVPRQQYSDFFLLLELLRIFPDAPLTLPQILQTLEQRGISAQVCQGQVLTLLEGHLPTGLVPGAQASDLLTAESRQNPDLQLLLETPLFSKVDGQTYRPNPQQWQLLRRYISSLLASTHQKLTQPLSLAL